jgi:hypothetical protein
VQTPRFCGHACIAGTLLRAVCGCRGLRISWLIVGILFPYLASKASVASKRV